MAKYEIAFLTQCIIDKSGAREWNATEFDVTVIQNESQDVVFFF